MQIRAASVDEDLDTLCRLRLEFVADHRGIAVADLSSAFVDATRVWLSDSHRDGRLRSWLATMDGSPVGSTSLALHDLPPRPEDHRSVDGRLLNVWVQPACRRRGVATALLEACLAAGPALGVRSWSLHATDDGRPLYASLGFVDNLAWMERLDVAGTEEAPTPP